MERGDVQRPLFHDLQTTILPEEQVGANHRVCLLLNTFPGGIVTRQSLVVSVDRM